MTVAVGVVGFGEAGAAIAAGLAGAGADVVATDTRLQSADGDRLRRLAAEQGVRLVPAAAAVAGEADVILSLVTSSAALPVATALAPHLRATHLVADLNSTSPGLACRVGEVIDASGAVFVDVAVMAAVPPHRHRVPMLASGPGAERFSGLPLELQVEVVGSEAGTASAIKMLRSLLVKGLEALLLEFAVAAHRFGATDRVLASMNGTLPTEDWRDLATYLLARTARHGARRGHELEEVATMLRELDIEPLLAEAGARRLLWAAERGLGERFADQLPAHYDEVLSALQEGRR